MNGQFLATEAWRSRVDIDVGAYELRTVIHTLGQERWFTMYPFGIRYDLNSKTGSETRMNGLHDNGRSVFGDGDHLASLCLAVGAMLWACATGAVEIGPGDDLESASAALAPGEELVLRGGTYFFDENVTITANGTPAAPVTIRAKAGEQPIIEQATTTHNVVEIRDSSYLIVRGIGFTGGSHGIRLMNSDFITIEDCELQETGDVAISANSGGTYEGLRILRNHIHHTNGTGEGMYLGCNNDGCRVANSLIEGNYIHHTNRPSVEQGDGIELKEGSYGNVIRDNVIHDTFYPGILVYSTVGNGPANIIEGNVVWNVSDNTVQVAADAMKRPCPWRADQVTSALLGVIPERRCLFEQPEALRAKMLCARSRMPGRGPSSR